MQVPSIIIVMPLDIPAAASFPGTSVTGTPNWIISLPCPFIGLFDTINVCPAYHTKNLALTECHFKKVFLNLEKEVDQNMTQILSILEKRYGCRVL